jgi:hypothetical protein
MGTILYEVLDVDGRLLFRTDEFDSADLKRLERVEALMPVPDGAAVRDRPRWRGLARRCAPKPGLFRSLEAHLAVWLGSDSDGETPRRGRRRFRFGPPRAMASPVAAIGQRLGVDGGGDLIAFGDGEVDDHGKDGGQEDGAGADGAESTTSVCLRLRQEVPE